MAPSNSKAKKEIQVDKSPAEFFAEHQAIAGFDNLGKSLYTSIRELVENSLDACEAIEVLPHIQIELLEYTQAEFNRLYVGEYSPRKASKDTDLFKKKGSNNNKNETSAALLKKKEDAYFKLVVTDNGCGMEHKAIPNLLGKVLSGSKYGVRQTRGKFGLGAKMTLIWGKKSSGQPISITTSHRTHADDIPESVSECVLDIDIYKNEPRVLKHKKRDNDQEWIGTRVEVIIAGNWTTYKSRALLYLQQLAIITPYADLDFTYQRLNDDKKTMHVRYERRSEQMPPPAKTIQPHPSGVNNLILQHLIQFTKTRTLSKFLTTELSSLSPSIVQRIVAELGYHNKKKTARGSDSESDDEDGDDKYAPQNLTANQITRLAQVLRAVACKGPDSTALSPLGEYNLNLGITKVLEPDIVATARDRPGTFEGHGFIVEAAVSLGGKDFVKEGIQVYRFANRIPLLFEGGGDVSTRVASTQIKWANYKIDPRLHKVGVFVSIVSTKIPFKGTSKEYIGDDAVEVQQSVKRALQSCCQQLRVHLMKRHAIKSAMERQSKLQKYIPDVSRSLYDLLDAMKERRQQRRRRDDNSDDHVDGDSGVAFQHTTSNTAALGGTPLTKRLRVDPEASDTLLRQLGTKITPDILASCLRETVQEQLETIELARKEADEATSAVPVYLVPLFNMDHSDPQHDFETELFTFRSIRPIKVLSNFNDECC